MCINSKYIVPILPNHFYYLNMLQLLNYILLFLLLYDLYALLYHQINILCLQASDFGFDLFNILCYYC